MAFNKQERRKKIHHRIRSKVSGTASRPRVAIYRSNKEIYTQLIDDVNGVTLVAASSRESSISKDGSKVEVSKRVGSLLADKAKSKDISSVVFDRSGYLFHGRVKALAEGAREGGLDF